MSECFTRTIERARVAVACARSLFRDGFWLECHEFMSKALRLQLQAWSEPGATEPSHSDVGASLDSTVTSERAFAALKRLSYRNVERLRAAAAAIAPAAAAPSAPPELDWVWAEVERLARFSAQHALTPRARKLRRLLCGAATALVGSLLVFAGFELWAQPRALASAQYSGAYAAANAIDGSDTTEWLLPDDVAGWVDVLLPYARTVHRVRLLNSHNAQSADRAAQAVRVTAFTQSGPAASVEGAFERFSKERSELVLAVEAQQVTRIRVEVVSHFKTGGGLAEVIVE